MRGGRRSIFAGADEAGICAGSVIPNGEICPSTWTASAVLASAFFLCRGGASSGESVARQPYQERKQSRCGAKAGGLELGRDVRTVHQAFSDRTLKDSNGADSPQSQCLGRLPASCLVNEHEVSSHLDPREDGIPLAAVQMAEPGNEVRSGLDNPQPRRASTQLVLDLRGRTLMTEFIEH